MVLVAAAIILHNSKILIARRAPHKFLGGFWEFPGGKIEDGESSECCLERELDEELQIKVEINAFLMEQYFDYGAFSVSLKVYVCQFLSGSLTLVDHDEIKWVDPENVLLYQLAPADVPIMKQYLLVSQQ